MSIVDFEFDEDAFVRSKDEIVAAMLAEFLTAVPDAYTGEDSVLRLLLETDAGQLESLYVAVQINREDMFVQSANIQALELYGDMYEIPRKAGVPAAGQIKFSGDAGVYIPVDTEISHNPGTGEENVLVYVTTEDGTIPSPGTPIAPSVADSGVAGLPNGTYEYVVTFRTPEGETIPGAISSAVTVTSKRVDLTGIPIGGPGTTSRRIYRRVLGGVFKLLTTLNDNVATTFQDNIADASLGAEPPANSTALAVQLDAISEEPGLIYNVIPGSITQMNDVPDGITAVINPSSFIGGTDEEDAEVFRERLLENIQAPGTGSPADVKTWVEAIAGVESATVFSNNNLGTPQNGHATVRISGPGGSVPSGALIAAVQAALDERGLQNITYHVAAFNAVSTDVTVDVTTLEGFTLADVTPSVDLAISEFINNLDAGETLYIAGIIDAVYGLSGIATLTVSVPATNLTTAADARRTPGTITIT